MVGQRAPLGGEQERVRDEGGADLLDLAERALAAPGWRLAFPAALEAAFERDTSKSRCRRLAISVLIGVFLYDAFILDDLILNFARAGQMMAVQLGVVTPLACVLALFIWREPPKLWRELAGTVVALFASASVAYFTRLVPEPVRLPVMFGMIVTITFANAVLHLRFAYAVASSLGSLAVFVIALRAPPVLAWPIATYTSMLVGAAILLTLLANHRLERELRRVYLLGLRERLLGLGLSDTNRQLERLSYHDALTGLPNRRLLAARLAELWDESNDGAGANPAPIGLLIIDIDFFKAYNDFYGHLAGDACLRAVAALLRQHMRAGIDLIARYGGEEFIAVMPGLDLPTCCQIAERIREAVAAARLPHRGRGGDDYLTVSIGVAALSPVAAASPGELIRRADSALYRAKEAGRNRISDAPASLAE